MAVERTSIESVRVCEADGSFKIYPWKPGTWYLIRDDQPFLDVLVRGQHLRPKPDPKADPRILDLDETMNDGAYWQRWDLTADLARNRRFGEISVKLKVPRDEELRCYVIPAALLSYRDVLAMVEDIESEFGFSAAWDLIADRPDRSWSRRTSGARTMTSRELVRVIVEELAAAQSIRREPFSELGPHSRRGTPLAENAVVSHWAARRCNQLRTSMDVVSRELDQVRIRSERENPEKRQEAIDGRMAELVSIHQELEHLAIVVARLGNVPAELGTFVHPTPLFQRDHRLRLLLRAFAPLHSEALSEEEAARSHYPPVFLNRLWELWAAVWLAREFRRIGFVGTCSAEASRSSSACSWNLIRDDITIDLDFEPEPTYVDYKTMPPAHEREMPVLEWAAMNQSIDPQRPFLGTEIRCSPDYLLRISQKHARFLIVGDATLASPDHHGKNESKPKIVENYRRTIGWSIEGEIVRCHPMGAFVVFPPPSSSWIEFERISGASDCTLLCPSPQDTSDARARLRQLLSKVIGDDISISPRDLLDFGSS